ncbi:MAG: DUF2971 domain-containing protein [Bacilli bacterium]|nr:DUF2971 domain-containing protein [Bacilli bacterium]
MDYASYKEKIARENIDSMPEYKVNKYFDNLLELIPNGGKLYKYRSFKSDKIELYLKALKDKYLWIPSASEMDDIMDSTLNIKLESDFSELEMLFREKPYLFIVLLYKKTEIFKKANTKDYKKLYDVYIKNLDIKNGTINTSAAAAAFKKYGINTEEASERIKTINDKMKVALEENKDSLIKMIDDFSAISTNNRESTNIFSMCETFDNDFLWDIYSEKNGFCIEYDFNKARTLSTGIKRKLLMTLKVEYLDNLKRFSIYSFLEKMMENDVDDDFKDEQKRLIMEQVTSKKKCYISEQEWRIIQYKTDHMMYADIVSSIIIDEKGLDDPWAKDLINIARENNLKILVRRFSRYNNEYIYKSYY